MPPTAWLHAHRGASADAPENTLAAFQLGLEQGADGIELDVQLSADGVPVVIHDPTLDRTTDQSGAVAELPARTIVRADTFDRWAWDQPGAPHASRACGWTLEQTRVPTLEVVLGWLPPDRGLVIDVKAAAAVPAILELLAKRADAANSVRLISFVPAAIDAARDLAPWLSTGLLLDEGDSFPAGVAWAAGHGHASVVPFDPDLGDLEDVRAKVDAAASQVLRLGCYVVNDPARACQLRGAGVAFLMTDQPGRIATALADRR